MKASSVIWGIVKTGLIVIVCILVVYGLIRLGHAGYDFGYRVFTEKSAERAPGKDVIVLIKDGMGLKETAELLEEKGLTSDSLLFMIQYKLTDYDEIVPGTYTLNTSMTTRELAMALSGIRDEEDTEEE